MSTKIIEIYRRSKLAVDDFKENQNNNFVCSCYTPGSSDELEPEHLVKVVSYDELKAHMCADGQHVLVTNPNDLQEVDELEFWIWLFARPAIQLHRHLADIINTREDRTLDFEKDSKQPVDEVVYDALEEVGYTRTASGYMFSIYEKGPNSIAINEFGISLSRNGQLAAHISHVFSTEDIILMFLAWGVIYKAIFHQFIKTNIHAVHNSTMPIDRNDAGLPGGNTGIFYPRASLPPLLGVGGQA